MRIHFLYLHLVKSLDLTSAHVMIIMDVMILLDMHRERHMTKRAQCAMPMQRHADKWLQCSLIHHVLLLKVKSPMLVINAASMPYFTFKRRTVTIEAVSRHASAGPYWLIPFCA